MDTSLLNSRSRAKFGPVSKQSHKKVSTMSVTLIGIDLAKSVFQVCGVNQACKPVFNKKIRRQQLLAAQYPDATIAMEACGGSNYWGRTLEERDFTVRLIPPKHVEPFVRGNKTDRNDAFAICEAARRGLR